MIEWLIMADIQGNAEKLMKMEHVGWSNSKRNTVSKVLLSTCLISISTAKFCISSDFLHNLVLCCKNFVPEGSKLITFDVFLRQSYNSYELTEFTDLDQFEHVLNEHELLHLYKDKLTKSFWDMVVLDVFLMNLERTTTDYGYLIYKDVVTPAPLFDNRTDGQACTVPLRKDGKPILRDDLLYSNEFKDFHDAVVRILPVLECKMDDIYNLIHKQECLSESQKSWKFEQLQKTLHDLKCSYAIS